MPNKITPQSVRNALQNSGTLSGNGTAVSVQGGKAVIFGIGKSTGTAGIYTFEQSFDDGANWSALTVVRLSDGASITATNAAESGETFIAPLLDGDAMVRVRISTNWVTTAPAVSIAVLH